MHFHALPSYPRNLEIADDVLDSNYSLVIRQAENRIHAAQAVLHEIILDKAR